MDALFGVPLVARVDPEKGPSVFSGAATGRFELGPESAGSAFLVASAAGYEPRRVDLADGDEVLEIRLDSVRAAALIVELEDGSPGAHFPVTWRAATDEAPERADIRNYIDSAAQRQGQAIVSETDGHGVSRVPLATPALAVALDPRHGVTKTVRVLPGQEVRVVLADESLSVQFVDHATREPLRGLELQAWFPREPSALSELLETDSDGVVRIAATSSPVLVRRPGAALWQSELIPHSAGVSVSGSRGRVSSVIRIDAIPGGEVLAVGVRTSGSVIRLIEKGSGMPIEGQARFRVTCGKELSTEPDDSSGPGGATIVSPGTSEGYLIREGVVELPFTVRGRGDDPEDRAKLVRGSHPTCELVILVAGYRPYQVHWGSNPSLDDAGVPTFELHAAETRMLKVQRADGLPFEHTVWIYSPAEDVFCLKSGGEPDGLYGPFEWFGGNLLVTCYPPQIESWVPAAEWEAQEVVTLTIPSSTGSIRVEGIPPAAGSVPLVALFDQSAEFYHPTSAGSGSCLFDRLAPGTYLVGPRAWVDGAVKQSFVLGDDMHARFEPRAWRHVVQQDRSTVVQWDDAWAAGRLIEGQVRIRSPGRIEPFLVPLYGPSGAIGIGNPAAPQRMIFGRRAPRIPIDREGRYRIGATDPVPILIAICVADETLWGGVQGLHVLEVIRPGESLDVPTASIELIWSGTGPSEDVSVAYEVPVEALRYPLATFHRRSSNIWVPGAALRIDGVPLHVEELRIGGLALPVQLMEGAVQRIEVDPGHLSRPGRER